MRAQAVSVELPLKDWPSAAELEAERAATSDRALEERLRRKRDIRRALGDGRTYSLPIVAWRLGDAVLLASCCEAYSVLQLELRRRFAGQTVVCMNLVNGSMGYLPPRECYDHDLYQVWQTRLIEVLPSCSWRPPAERSNDYSLEVHTIFVI